MHTIKNTLLALLTALTLTTVNAENLTARLGTGYTMAHVVNGVQRSESSVFAGLDLGVTYDKIDFFELGGFDIPIGFGLASWSCEEFRSDGGSDDASGSGCLSSSIGYKLD